MTFLVSHDNPHMLLRFTSIRWRLVASYVLLTVLTVSVLVLLATTLVRQYIERQEMEALQANADAIAQQAMPLMLSNAKVRTTDLDRLARTAAFLSNTRVSVLDADRNTIVNSGLPPTDQVIMLVPPGVELDPNDPMALLTLQVFDETAQRQMPLMSQLPPGSKLTLVRRVSTPWGSRLIFEANSDPAALMQHQDPSNHTGDTANANTAATTRIVDAAVQVPGQPNPLGFVQVSSRRDLNSETLQPIVQNMALAGGIAAVLAALIGLAVSSGLTQPVQRLTQTVTRISQGDLSARTQLAPNQQPHDEIGQLAGQFDQMATRLQASFGELEAERDALRRFIADASHELRTPITAMRMYNELLQGQAGDDANTRREFLNASEQQLHRLAWITQNLLDLSRLDAGLIKLNLSDIDAQTLLQQVIGPFATSAEQKQIHLGLELDATPTLVYADQPRLEMVLSNLLDNAIKFTPEHGQVTLSVAQLPNAVRFTVADSGPGIPASDLPHIFDRFYRGANESLASGNGLGLAIVQSLVRAHGGHVRVESTVGQGNRFIVELPKRGGASS